MIGSNGTLRGICEHSKRSLASAGAPTPPADFVPFALDLCLAARETDDAASERQYCPES